MTALLATVLLLMTGCSEVNPVYTPAAGEESDGNKTEVSTGFALGADISWVTQLENENYTFSNADGETMECTALMKEIGMNAIRLRVWVDPDNGWCNAGDVLVKAARAQELGMRLMIDFHYSDTWADPGTQLIPEAWLDYTTDELAEAVAAHTTEVLTILKNNRITNVEWVQVGNEITHGMLYHTDVDENSDGTTTTAAGGNLTSSPANFTRFINAGYEASKAVYPDAAVIVHIDRGHDANYARTVCNSLKAHGGKYDVIGLSLYPESASERIGLCVSNITTLYNEFGKDVMICETGMQYDDPDTAYGQLCELLEGAEKSGHCLGVFYWEPECPPGYNGYYKGAFDENGRPTRALDAFTEAAAE